MKNVVMAVWLGSTIAVVSPVSADDESTPGFTNKSGDPVEHVEVHHHYHSDVRDAPAEVEVYRRKGEDLIETTEVHIHYHPEVREAPAGPEPFQKK